MIMDLKTVLGLLKSHPAGLRQHGVKSLSVFGWLRRGEANPHQ